VVHRPAVLGREAGIEGLHPHMLRHTFAHAWLAEGGNEGDLPRLRISWAMPLSVIAARPLAPSHSAGSPACGCRERARM
jgi:hypothetical protein